jgi:RHS repeat-associated protein
MQSYVNGQFNQSNIFFSEQRGNTGYTNHAFPTDQSKCEYLTVTYYDDYVFLTAQPADWGSEYAFIDDYGAYDTEILSPVKGQVTGTKTRVLGTDDWIKSTSWYDRKYRPVQAAASNQLNGVDRSFTRYDFVGKVLQTRTIHKADSQEDKLIEDTFTYDHAGRQVDQYSTVGEAVTWKDNVGVTVTDNDLANSAAQGWGNSGAATVNKIPSGKNGWIESRIDETNSYRMMGLSPSNTNAHYNTIKYALYTRADGYLYVYENGSNKGQFTVYNKGDFVRVERIGNQIHYKQNGKTFYTSTVTWTDELIGDVALYSTNATFKEVYMSTTGTALLAHNDYNELGELVDKQLHSTDNGASYMQSVDYRYNIRGWLNSINNAALVNNGTNNDDDDDFFGMELGYETNIGTNAQTMFNGNISAIKWSNFGAPEGITERAYNYGYDNINRLKSAGHKIKNVVWADAGNSVKVDNIVYDYNGNIKSLNRRDLLGGNMDLLTYSYGTGINQSNKLLSVTDAGNDLEGFKDGNASGNDYLYDANGNMYQDLNKGIQHIWYNHLNLPDSLDMGGGKTIKYTYDAAGVKQRQTIYEGSVVKKQTDYIGGFIYEDTVLQLIQHAEGRIVPPRGDTGGEFVYEYHLKDHLGNVRLTFTTEPGEDAYTATLENATQQQEQADFHPSYDNITRSNASIYDHTDNGSSTYSLMLDGQPNRIIGLAKSMQVLPGDTVNMQVYGKYLAATATNNNLATGLFPAITGAFGLTASATGELLNAYNALEGLFGAGPLIGPGDWEDDNAPKAYLNYILFDKNFVAYDMGFNQINIDALEDGTDKTHDVLSLEAAVTRPGYIYIYLSNENSKQIEVYFDDLTIKHKHTAVIQTDDYYPFGLAIAGLSGRTENKVENRFLYNGKELQTDLNLDWYDYGARMYDASLARFTTIDPLAEVLQEAWTPYHYVKNNPVKYMDPTGMIWKDQKEADKLKENVENRKTELAKRKSNLQAKIIERKEEGKSTKAQEKSIARIDSRTDQLNQTIKDIDALGADKNNTFDLVSGDNQGDGKHGVSRGSDGVVNIYGSNDGLHVHEIRHVSLSLSSGGLIFRDGKLAPTTPRGAFDEIEGYKAEYGYTGSGPGSAGSDDQILNEIANMKDDNDNYVYPAIRQQIINRTNGIRKSENYQKKIKKGKEVKFKN